uniref:Uncharacterized protein n=1 Tax=Panagrolaimus sp. PS1159 TaxID=55785 RepID=A0AC35FS84_9BILA
MYCWDKYKKRLIRQFFEDQKERQEFEDFVNLCEKRGQKCDHTGAKQEAKKYDTKLACRVKFIDEYIDVSSLNDLAEGLIPCFLELAAIFYQNCNRNEFEKLLKIRETQKSLPIAEYRKHILDTLKENQILILAGDTGCGKSTQHWF